MIDLEIIEDKESALDRINVRRHLLEWQKAILDPVDTFGPHDCWFDFLLEEYPDVAAQVREQCEKKNIDPRTLVLTGPEEVGTGSDPEAFNITLQYDGWNSS